VYSAADAFELEEAAHKIFRHAPAMAVSPFYDILTEYRCIVLDGEALLAYRKEIPCVVGDGESTLLALLARHMLGSGRLPDADEVALARKGGLGRVLRAGERWRVGWKSNLGQGAAPKPVEDAAKGRALAELAARAAGALGMRFLSVDMIDVPAQSGATGGDIAAGGSMDGGTRTMVLEANSGVMMEHFAQASAQNMAVAKSIYRKAIHRMLAIETGA